MEGIDGLEWAGVMLLVLVCLGMLADHVWKGKL